VKPKKPNLHIRTSGCKKKSETVSTESVAEISWTGPRVRELARVAVGDEQNPYRQAKRVFEFVRKNMRCKETSFKKRGVQPLLDHPFKDEKTGEEYYKGTGQVVPRDSTLR
jgi:hypothetical protein